MERKLGFRVVPTLRHGSIYYFICSDELHQQLKVETSFNEEKYQKFRIDLLSRGSKERQNDVILHSKVLRPGTHICRFSRACIRICTLINNSNKDKQIC